MEHANSVIIIPVYNEEEVIKEVIVDVLSKFKNVICIDDGSTDNSISKIAETKATLIKHPLNLGQGAAIQTGLDYALKKDKIQYFITYDADGQHNLHDVETMLKIIKKDDLDIVLGSRFLGKAENIPNFKKIILKLAVIFTNRTSGLKLTDTHNGLRVFNRKVAESLNITMPDFSHASEVLERIAQKKFTYKEVPITIVYTEYSRKKGQSLLNAINISFDVLIKRLSK
jgi:glycosyltransferase involved in cell wall biosynthesis